MDCKIKDVFIASPLESEDINKFKIKFCLVKNGQIKIITSDENENVIYTLQDVNNIDEYYSKKYYVRNFWENKERIFKDYMQLYDVQEICKMSDEAELDFDYLTLIEKIVNEFYLENK